MQQGHVGNDGACRKMHGTTWCVRSNAWRRFPRPAGPRRHSSSHSDPSIGESVSPITARAQAHVVSWSADISAKIVDAHDGRDAGASFEILFSTYLVASSVTAQQSEGIVERSCVGLRHKVAKPQRIVAKSCAKGTFMINIQDP